MVHTHRNSCGRFYGRLDEWKIFLEDLLFLVAICIHQADSPLHVDANCLIMFCYPRVRDVIHDAECSLLRPNIIKQPLKKKLDF